MALRVIEIGQDEDGRRMFEQAIRHFRKREAHVFVAISLATT